MSPHSTSSSAPLATRASSPPDPPSLTPLFLLEGFAAEFEGDDFGADRAEFFGGGQGGAADRREHVLLAFDRVDHRGGAEGESEVAFVERLTGLRVEGIEDALLVAGEDEAAGGGGGAAVHRGRHLLLPEDLG